MAQIRAMPDSAINNGWRRGYAHAEAMSALFYYSKLAERRAHMYTTSALLIVESQNWHLFRSEPRSRRIRVLQRAVLARRSSWNLSWSRASYGDSQSVLWPRRAFLTLSLRPVRRSRQIRGLSVLDLWEYLVVGSTIRPDEDQGPEPLSQVPSIVRATFWQHSSRATKPGNSRFLPSVLGGVASPSCLRSSPAALAN